MYNIQIKASTPIPIPAYIPIVEISKSSLDLFSSSRIVVVVGVRGKVVIGVAVVGFWATVVVVVEARVVVVGF